MSRPTDVECPVKSCQAFKGFACVGTGYGYHAAGYHPSRSALAERQATAAADTRSKARDSIAAVINARRAHGGK